MSASKLIRKRRDDFHVVLFPIGRGLIIVGVLDVSAEREFFIRGQVGFVDPISFQWFR